LVLCGDKVWRYYLLVNRPEQSDTIFTWKDFAAKNNTELLNNLGNFVNRSLNFCFARFEGCVPAVKETTAEDAQHLSKLSELVESYVEVMEAYKLKDGLKIAMKLSSQGNLYMQENKPWVLLKSDRNRCGTVTAVCVNIAYTFLLCELMFMPALPKIFWQVFCGDSSGPLHAWFHTQSS